VHERDAVGDRLLVGGLERGQRPLEVVEDGQQVVEEPLGGPPAQLLVLAGDALLVVVELRGDAAQRVEVLIALALGAREGVELLGRRVAGGGGLPAVLGGEGLLRGVRGASPAAEPSPPGAACCCASR